MAFPNDLSNVAVFKIHPTIGTARVANNDDYYEFFAQQALAPEERKYMSDVAGVPTMRRQAVQFRIFAYDESLGELGELTAQAMEHLSLAATWSANIGNRKLLNYGAKKGTPLPAMNASGSASGDQIATLEADNPWNPNQKVTLGNITGGGLFIPGHGGVIRRTPGAIIDPYPANQGGNLGCADTTADGAINAALTGTDVPVIPACVVCAPQQHSPDVNASNPALGNRDDITPVQATGNNLDWTMVMKDMLGVYGTPPANAATAMDAEIINTTNGEFSPGMENSFDFRRTEFDYDDLPNIFYPRGENFIGENEIRPRYKIQEDQEKGALPGQLTSGLCSTWQGDLWACLQYWTAEFPQKVSVNGTSRFLFRQECDSTDQMNNAEEINRLADNMGVARNMSADPAKIDFVETERNC